MNRKGENIPQEYFIMRKTKKELFKMYLIRELHQVKNIVSTEEKERNRT